MAEYTPYQKKIIKRYYDNQEAIGYQKLTELVSDIYLASGKKADSLWKRVGAALTKLGLSEKRIEHLLESRDVQLLANVVKEMNDRQDGR